MTWCKGSRPRPAPTEDTWSPTEVVLRDLVLPQAEWWDRENRDLPRDHVFLTHDGVRTKPCSWVLWSFHTLKFISTAV